MLALDASSGLFLLCATAQAFNVGNFVPIERVIELVVSDGLPLLVVAQATRVKPALAYGVRTLFLAGASVVFASQGFVGNRNLLELSIRIRWRLMV